MMDHTSHRQQRSLLCQNYNLHLHFVSAQDSINSNLHVDDEDSTCASDYVCELKLKLAAAFYIQRQTIPGRRLVKTKSLRNILVMMTCNIKQRNGTFYTIIFFIQIITGHLTHGGERFLVANTRLYTLPCRSVGLQVGPSVVFLNADWIDVYLALFLDASVRNASV